MFRILIILTFAAYAASNLCCICGKNDGGACNEMDSPNFAMPKEFGKALAGKTCQEVQELADDGNYQAGSCSMIQHLVRRPGQNCGCAGEHPHPVKTQPPCIPCAIEEQMPGQKEYYRFTGTFGDMSCSDMFLYGATGFLPLLFVRKLHSKHSILDAAEIQTHQPHQHRVLQQPRSQ